MTQYEQRDPEVDELTSTLLRSLRGDVAPSHAKRATLAALGIGAATTAAAGSASAFAFAGMARIGVLAITKAVAGGAIAGAVVVGTSVYVQHRASPSPSSVQVRVSPAPTSVGPRKTDALASPPVGATEEKGPGADEISPPIPRAVTVIGRPRDEGAGATVNPAPRPLDTPTTTAPDPIPVARPSALAREIALLDESRGALARNDSREALLLLDRYAREFEQGNLWPEAVVLKIDALLRQGDVQAARFLADQFERARPNDSHVSRIESLFSNAGVPHARAPGSR